MATRWIFSTEGKACFYQEGEHIYGNPSGRYAYWESNGWRLKTDGGTAAYFVSDDWIYTPNGKPAFYYG